MLLAIFVLSMITAFCWIIQLLERLQNKKQKYVITKLHLTRKTGVEKRVEKCDNADCDICDNRSINPYRLRRLSGAKPDHV